MTSSGARTLSHANIDELEPGINALLRCVAEREAPDAAPGDDGNLSDEQTRRDLVWRERWIGVKGWFRFTNNEPPQADLLRASARSVIPKLLGAIATLNERRRGRSDRSADFRVLARWFAACATDDDAHRLARAAFALNPARHFVTSGSGAPALLIHPRLREYGEAIRAVRRRAFATAPKRARYWRSSSLRNRSK